MQKLIILIVLLIVSDNLMSSVSGRARKRFNYCANDQIYRIGTKVICEYLIARKPVSCISPIRETTKAYINCRYGYQSSRNISEQQIRCLWTGEWSDEPMACEDICGGKETKISVPHINEKKEMWYVDIKGITSTCPGIILNAKILLSTANCLAEYKPFQLQLATEEDEPQDLIVKDIIYDRNYRKNSNDKYEDDVLAIIVLENNIIYTSFVRSACLDYSSPSFAKQANFIKDNLQTFKSSKTLDYSFIKSPCAAEHFIKTQTNERATEFTCYLNNQKISCDQPLELGSIVRIGCKLGYQKRNLDSPDEIKCLEAGKWSSPVNHQCSLVCGELDRTQPSLISLSFGGTPIDIISVPWHIAIYSNNTENRGKYEQICGGTLVHFNVVISAAHCFFDPAKNSVADKSSYVLATGKRYRNYNSPEQNRVQYSRIREINLPSTYNEQFYRHDIAIIVLEKDFEFNAVTRPACIDWLSYGSYDIEAGKKGRVVGWGATSSSDSSSDELLAIEIVTLSNDDCKQLIDPNHKDEITGEKFCAKGIKGESACKGDSGGGFLVKKRYNFEEDRYHIWGVVSSGLNPTKHCTQDFLTTYTNVQYHQDIIKAIIERNINTS